MPNKGDTAWMLISTALVLMMSIPGLALFYGGLVRTKNMASMLSQVFAIVAIVSIIWVPLRLFARLYRRRAMPCSPSPTATIPGSAFSKAVEWNNFIGGFDKAFPQRHDPGFDRADLFQRRRYS